LAEDYIIVRFHHGGTFIKAPDPKYIGEREMKVTTIDKDHFSVVELINYSKDMGYETVGGFYVFNSNTNGFVLLENDNQILNIVSHLKHGAFLDLFISHVGWLEEGVPFGLDNSINKGSRATLDGLDSINAEQTAVENQSLIEQVENNTYLTREEENTNLGDDNTILPSDLESSESELDAIPEEDDSELDDECRALRQERRRKNNQNPKKKRKNPPPTPEVELGEAGADKGFDDIDRPNKRD
ncbi:hypothetical protein A4A49_55628, partial [Nicotiana attenuata]